MSSAMSWAARSSGGTPIATMAYPHAYVRRMIVNEYLSWRRRLQRITHHAEVDDHTALVHDGAAEHAERDAMIARLDRLPHRQRAAVVLRYYVGLSDAEIAAELGCRQSTVRSQVSRALHSLRIDITGPAEYLTPEILESR